MAAPPVCGRERGSLFLAGMVFFGDLFHVTLDSLVSTALNGLVPI